ncbi:DeoR/GlpR family DNA-binding transcription regulator [Vibrio mangrovi]|uniref:DeoR/GlpR family DNA-binding transcription regulator n=1 Tax=Vibrio mangrovi TaxID=474394 RepID=A0A1Y6J0P2_9VIBR|nr:DeoR/GlpR family DNA-binding transcription regulator [Vibrio mangrovi]MDW6005140.1 DeoR/GlpR family DNA-binding transcription regulator [Vibrio mangrovi]SMS02650.1 Glucitol operon repressor [Vibrio mangrovi]
MRRKQIVDIVNNNSQVSVIQLAQEFSVSVETIRRDLKFLDKQGLIVRIHGGATSKTCRDIGKSFDYRAKNNIHEKQMLVEYALEYIEAGMIIGLDASSSSWLLAQAIPNIQCTIVTNCTYVISALSHKNNINIVGVGGSYSEKYKSFYGIIARNTLEKIALDVCFISCVGVDFDTGIWDSNEYNYDIKQSLIRSSKKTILIADKSKLHKRSLLKICDINTLACLITNAELNQQEKEHLQSSGVGFSGNTLPQPVSEGVE